MPKSMPVVSVVSPDPSDDDLMIVLCNAQGREIYVDAKHVLQGGALTNNLEQVTMALAAGVAPDVVDDILLECMYYLKPDMIHLLFLYSSRSEDLQQAVALCFLRDGSRREFVRFSAGTDKTQWRGWVFTLILDIPYDPNKRRDRITKYRKALSYCRSQNKTLSYEVITACLRGLRPQHLALALALGFKPSYRHLGVIQEGNDVAPEIAEQMTALLTSALGIETPQPEPVADAEVLGAVVASETTNTDDTPAIVPDVVTAGDGPTETVDVLLSRAIPQLSQMLGALFPEIAAARRKPGERTDEA